MSIFVFKHTWSLFFIDQVFERRLMSFGSLFVLFPPIAHGINKTWQGWSLPTGECHKGVCDMEITSSLKKFVFKFSPHDKGKRFWLKRASTRFTKFQKFYVCCLRWRHSWRLIVKLVLVIFSKNADRENAVQTFIERWSNRLFVNDAGFHPEEWCVLKTTIDFSFYSLLNIVSNLSLYLHLVFAWSLTLTTLSPYYALIFRSWPRITIFWLATKILQEINLKHATTVTCLSGREERTKICGVKNSEKHNGVALAGTWTFSSRILLATSINLKTVWWAPNHYFMMGAALNAVP